MKELADFEHYLNSVTDGIKIKFDDHEQELNFLDTVIYKEEQEEYIEIEIQSLFQKDRYPSASTYQFFSPKTHY